MATQGAQVLKKKATKKASKSKQKAQDKKEIKLLSPIEIEELVLEHRENGRKLARSMLRRWRARIAPEEIDSMVDLTLCEAAKRFDPNNGASFMTFYFYHLRGFLVRAVASAVNNNNIVLAFDTQDGYNPTENAIAGDDMFAAQGTSYSSVNPEEIDSPESSLMRKENITVCRSACKQLDPLEQEVLIRSFNDEEPLVDIARSLGYSRCHISRVKKRALERLAEILEETGALSQVGQDRDGFTNREASAGRRKPKRRSRRREIKSNRRLEAHKDEPKTAVA